MASAEVNSMPAPPPFVGDTSVEEDFTDAVVAEGAEKDEDADSVIIETTSDGAPESRSTNSSVSVGSVDSSEDTVKVFLRLRPHTKPDSAELEFVKSEGDALLVMDGTTVQTIAPNDSQSFKNRETGGKFCFTKVFDKPTKQEELFEETTASLVDTFIDGKDGLLFAYGVTNAGKTYTVEGCEENPGIIPRTLQLVFDKIVAKNTAGEKGVSGSVQVSYLQVYNEQVYDLQQEPGEEGKSSRIKERLKIKLRDDGVEVEGLRTTEILSCKEGLDIVERGRKARETHETQCNVASSRSHSVFVISMDRKDAGPDSKPARLYIVDLAGSERGKRTVSSRVRQREASNINCSLMNLMRCLDTLRLNQKNKKLRKKEKMVPFRESKLTLLFRDCFVGGNCGGVAMIINASARPEDYDETAHALKYGALVKSVQVNRAVKTPVKRRSPYGFNGRRVGASSSTDESNAGKGKGNASNPRPLFGRKGKKNQLSAKQRAAKAVAASGNNNGGGSNNIPLQPDDNGGVSDSTTYQTNDEESYDSEFDDIPSEHHPLISALLYELADARLKCVTMEAEVREEVAAEMTARLEEMEAVFRQRVDAAKKISQRTSDSLLENLRKRMATKNGEEGADNIYTMDAIVHEFEEEMQRMRELYSAEIKVLERKVEKFDQNNKLEGGATATDKKDVAKMANRKSFERLDKVVGSQFGMIERYKEELEEERAMHEKTTRQLESATMLSKDAQKCEAEMERRNMALALEIVQLQEALRKARAGNGSANSTSTGSTRESIGRVLSSHRIPSILGGKQSKFKLVPNHLGKHVSVTASDEAWIALQQAGNITNQEIADNMQTYADSECVSNLKSAKTDPENSSILANASMPESKKMIKPNSRDSVKPEANAKRSIVSKLVGKIYR